MFKPKMDAVLTDKRNATLEFCGSPRTLGKASGLIELIDFCLTGMLAIHEYFNCGHQFYFLLSNSSKILHVAILLPVSIEQTRTDKLYGKLYLVRGSSNKE